ncbi:hypothetical protein O1M63_06895 [Streptomyces mirabilis]|nr:hypothetical protein [Streptomyces mirabilis]
MLADAHQRQYFYLARIRSWSEADRTGPEFADPDRGEYRLEEVPLSIQALDALSLEPGEHLSLEKGCVWGVAPGRELGQPRSAVVSRVNWRWPISL